LSLAKRASGRSDMGKVLGAVQGRATIFSVALGCDDRTVE
jgi:hypothetical protein